MYILVVELPIAVQYKCYTYMYFYFSSFEIKLHWFVLNVSWVNLMENFYQFVIKKGHIYILYPYSIRAKQRVWKFFIILIIKNEALHGLRGKEQSWATPTPLINKLCVDLCFIVFLETFPNTFFSKNIFPSPSVILCA